MSTAHAGLSANASDPTRTKTARSKLAAYYRGRVDTIAGIIRTTIGENDALRLGDRQRPPVSGPRTSGFAGGTVVDFGTESDDERLEAWRAWIESVLDRHLVGPGRGESEPYLRQGYARGLALANTDANRAGIVDADELDSPTDVITNDRHQSAIRREAIGLEDDLEKRATDIRTETTRSLNEELLAGITTYAAADALTERLRTRAESFLTTIANTRIVDMVNEAILQRGREIGAEQVGVVLEHDVEWETVNDSKTCARCLKLADGGPYPLGAVFGGAAPRPVRDSHPNCRCRLSLIG